MNVYLVMIGRFVLDYKPWTMLWSVPQVFFFPKKMTSLEIVDMYLIIFDVFSQYLRLSQRLAVRNI